MWDDVWSTAAQIGGDSSWRQSMNTDTVPSNAIQSMEPVANQGGGFGNFWSQVGGVAGNFVSGLAQVKLQDYANRNAVRNINAQNAGQLNLSQQQQLIQQRAMAGNSRTLLVWGGLGLGAVVLVMLLKK